MKNWKAFYVQSGIVLLLLIAITSLPLAAQTNGYISNWGNGTVSVLDPATNAVVGSPITVGTNPSYIALTPDGKHAYVANTNQGVTGGGTVSVIDTSTNTVVATVPVGDQPFGVAITPDGTRAYVVDFGFMNGAGISIIDTSTNTVIATIPSTVVLAPFEIVFSPDGTRAYVNDLGAGKVLVFDTATNTVSATVTTGYVGGIAITPDGAHLYVSDSLVSAVSVINTSTNTISAGPISVGSSPTDFAILPDGSKVYVANDSGSSVSVIDTATNTVTATIGVGSCPTVPAISPDGSKIFVPNFCSSTISAINPSTNTVSATITDPGVFFNPYGLVFPHSQQQTPAQMVASLIAAVQGMNIQQQGTSLIDQLQLVANDLTAQNSLACTDLNNFISHVRAQTGKKITMSQSSQLLAASATINGALSCGP